MGDTLIGKSVEDLSNCIADAMSLMREEINRQQKEIEELRNTLEFVVGELHADDILFDKLRAAYKIYSSQGPTDGALDLIMEVFRSIGPGNEPA